MSSQRSEDRALIGPILQFEIKSHLVDKSQFKNKSKVTLKHWHKLHLIENQISPANSVCQLFMSMPCGNHNASRCIFTF
jgi:hypothetical protein